MTFQWIALCDADDLWHPDKLRIQHAVAAKTGADLVCTAIEDFSPDDYPPAWLAAPVRDDGPVTMLTYAVMLLKNRIATSSVLCRRDHLLRSGGFDTA